MRIISWNVNGIRAVHKKGCLLPLIEEYEPDILCLQETKANEDESPVDLPEYKEYWNSAERRGYSGTAIFTKATPLKVTNGLPSSLITRYRLVDDGYGDPAKEGRVVTAEYKNFYVVTVYTPNAKDDLSRLALRYKNWDPAFLAYMKELEKKKPVIFCGDLNVAHTEIDLARPKENRGKKGFTDEERVGIQNMVDAGFLDSFRIFTKEGGHYSWWSHFANARERNIGWRMDYIFISVKLQKKAKKASILPSIMGSDHCPTLLDVAL